MMIKIYDFYNIFLELKNKIEYYLYIILLYKNKIGRNVLFLLQSISLMAK